MKILVMSDSREMLKDLFQKQIRIALRIIIIIIKIIKTIAKN